MIFMSSCSDSCIQNFVSFFLVLLWPVVSSSTTFRWMAMSFLRLSNNFQTVGCEHVSRDRRAWWLPSALFVVLGSSIRALLKWFHRWTGYIGSLCLPPRRAMPLMYTPNRCHSNGASRGWARPRVTSKSPLLNPIHLCVIFSINGLFWFSQPFLKNIFFKISPKINYIFFLAHGNSKMGFNNFVGVWTRDNH